MDIEEFFNDCIHEISDLIFIKQGDLDSLNLKQKALADEILRLKLKRGVYRFYLEKKGELKNHGSN